MALQRTLILLKLIGIRMLWHSHFAYLRRFWQMNVLFLNIEAVVVAVFENFLRRVLYSLIMLSTLSVDQVKGYCL